MRRPPARPALRTARRGAALLLSMVILVLVATVAAGMVWQQRRALDVEAAERARAQSAWMLGGALDWVGLLLREDTQADRRRRDRNGQPVPPFDALGEPWATPLAESRLSSFLAADRDNSLDLQLDVFLSGRIADAQSRWNLRNLIDGSGKIVPAEQAAFQRLAGLAGASSEVADRIAAVLLAAWAPANPEAARSAPLPPAQLADLAWHGIEPGVIQLLEPHVTLLPVRTPVNANTAGAPALVAAIDGLDLGSAERIVQARRRKDLQGLVSLAEIKSLLAPTIELDPQRVSVTSSYFEVIGRLRLEDRVLEERSLVERRDNRTLVRRRERVSGLVGG